MLQYLKKAGKFLGTILISPVIALNYAIVKTYKSLKYIYKMITCQPSHKDNLFSLLRIIITIAGGFHGAQGGILLGALLGSMAFPGIGTLIGSIVGGILGSCYGAGLGAFVGKQLKRGISWIQSKLEDSSLSPEGQINTTNPCKYLPLEGHVNNERTAYLNEAGESAFSLGQINAVMKQIYQEKTENKKKISFLGSICSWLASKNDKQALQTNEEYNEVLECLRKGKVKGNRNPLNPDSVQTEPDSVQTELDITIPRANSVLLFKAKLAGTERRGFKCDPLERMEGYRLVR